jgi:hypothetical protein
MAAKKLAYERAHTGYLPAEQGQRLGQKSAQTANDLIDAIAVLNNRAYVELAVTVTTGLATFGTILTTSIRSLLKRGFLIITFSASGVHLVALGTISFQFLVDGVVYRGCYTTVPVAGYSFAASPMIRVPVTAGLHAVSVQWNTGAPTASITPTFLQEHARLLVQEAL